MPGFPQSGDVGSSDDSAAPGRVASTPARGQYQHRSHRLALVAGGDREGVGRAHAGELHQLGFDLDRAHVDAAGLDPSLMR
jgi:hypothetical protein